MSFALTAGQAADSPQFVAVLQKVRIRLPVGRPRTRPDAVAADKAAPIAHKAGGATAEASTKLAERSRGWAAEVREHVAPAGSTGTSTASGTSTATADPTQTAREVAEDNPPL